MSLLPRGLNLSNFDRYVLNDHHADALREFFGLERFGALRDLFGGPRPKAGARTVILIPGILGTTLAIGGDTLWVDVEDIAKGRLPRLLLEPGDRFEDDRDVTPTVGERDPLREIYGPMQSFLELCGFEVVPLGIDWRRSMDAAADKLHRELAKHPGRVSIVGHSMGCLIARRCAQRHKDDLARIERAVFLGPPFLGSFDPLRVMTGQHAPAELLDGLVGRAQIEQVFKTFPAFAELIADVDAFELAELYDPKSGLLARFHPKLPPRAKAFAKNLRKRDQEDAADPTDRAFMARAVTVATTCVRTAVGASLGPNSEVIFDQWGHGDGVVPALSMWDDRASAHYSSLWYHPVVPLEPAVIHGVASLLGKDGSAGLLEKLHSAPADGATMLMASLDGQDPIASDNTLRVGPLDSNDRDPERRRGEAARRVRAGRWRLDDLRPKALREEHFAPVKRAER